MDPLYFKNREDWHRWLLKNAEAKQEAWLLYYKKHTKKATIPYEDAVLEALAFGWIDGKVRSVDSEKYMQRFTPRRKGSVWSETNLKRVKRLIKEKRMTAAGLEAAKDVLSGKKKAEPSIIPNTIKMPRDLQIALKRNETARSNFTKFPPSSKKIFFWWIQNAKSLVTKEKRISVTVKSAEKMDKLGWTKVSEYSKNK